MFFFYRFFEKNGFLIFVGFEKHIKSYDPHDY